MRAGFSAVLFAIKVVLTQQSSSSRSRYISCDYFIKSSVMGFVVPTKYVYWFELVLIQVLVPNASFIGHLCGILTGLLCIFANIISLLDVKGYLEGLFQLMNLLPDFAAPPPSREAYRTYTRGEYPRRY